MRSGVIGANPERPENCRNYVLYRAPIDIERDQAMRCRNSLPGI
jgi:hypothetical protein